MATNTTNFGLKKPAYSDTADIADINGNMDKVDVSLNGLADAVAIVANNNTHAAITAGQYVYVHGHGSLAEGLYKANSNIAANATLTSSNLTADSSGGLNALNSNINTKANVYQKDTGEITVNVSAKSGTAVLLSDEGLAPPAGYALFSIVPIVTGASSIANAITHLQGMGGYTTVDQWAVVINNVDSADHTWTVRIIAWYVRNYSALPE